MRRRKSNSKKKIKTNKKNQNKKEKIINEKIEEEEENNEEKIKNENNENLEEDLNEEEKSENQEIFSLDSLLEAREEENKQISTYSKYLESGNQSDDDVVIIPKFSLKPLLERDGSVFTFNDSSFPIRCLSFLEIDEDKFNIHLTPQLTEMQWAMIQYQSESVMPSQTLLFSLIQQLIVTGNTDIGEYLLDYSMKFPFESIEYRVYVDYLKEAIVSAQSISCYIIAIARYRIFINSEPAINKSRNLQILLLHIASILTPQTSTPSAFNRVVQNLIDMLKSLSLDQDDYSYIITKSLELSHDQPFSNVSYLVSLFPLNFNGAAILGPFAANVALTLLHSEGEGIEGLCESISSLKTLCYSQDSNDLVIASAVLALSERAIVCGIKFKLLDEAHLDMFLNGLQFNMVNIGGKEALMIRIREQLHITRTQIELYKEFFKTK